MLDAGLPIVLGLAAVVLARGLPRRRLLAACGLLASSLATAAGVAASPADAGTRGARVAACLAALAVIAALCAAAEPALRLLRARVSVDRIARRLVATRAIDDVGRAIARAVGDPAAELRYATGTGWVDATGRAVTAPPFGSLEVRSGGAAVAAIVASPGHAAPITADDVGPALALAVANERLRAVARARVEQLRASRGRIVAAADAARRGLERDLHDGVQQRVVALSFELRRARGRASGPLADRLERAIDETAAALADLRELAHGIFPAVLAEAGLAAALHQLADTAPLAVACSVDPRLDAGAELAAYALVAGAVERLPADGPVVTATVERHALGGLIVRLALPATSADDDALLAGCDRVAAAGGRVAITSTPTGRRLVAELPCAS